MAITIKMCRCTAQSPPHANIIKDGRVLVGPIFSKEVGRKLINGGLKLSEITKNEAQSLMKELDNLALPFNRTEFDTISDIIALVGVFSIFQAITEDNEPDIRSLVQLDPESRN